MLEKLSLDQALVEARSYANEDKIEKAQELYETILKDKIAEAQELCQGVLMASSKIKQDQQELTTLQNPPQEMADQLVNLYNLGQLAVVVEQAEILTQQYSNSFFVWNILGASNLGLGKIEKASQAFKKVTELNPHYEVGFNNLGVTFKEQGRLDAALEAFNKALSIKPAYAEALNNIGNVMSDQGKLDKSIEAYKQAITIKPDYADAYYNMGDALKNQYELEDAIEAYNKAISLKPDHHEAHNNMGLILQYLNKFDEAIEYYKKSLSIKPDYAEAYNNMGNALQNQDKIDDAMEAYSKSMSLKTDYADAHQNYSFALLNSGRVKEGLDEYEWRLKTSQFLSKHRHFSQPLWDGNQSLNGKRILIWCEQGIGDTINWSSCLSLITSQAKHCILECQDKLVPLLERSFPNVEVKPQNKLLDSKRDDFDFHLPMGSLYKHFINELTQNTKVASYLVPDPVRVSFWKKRLKSLGNAPYIGISWKSSNMSPERLPNYTSLSEWSPVLTIPDVTFINLQYKDYEDDLKKVKDELGVTIHNFDDIDHYDDIDDVAALCKALDMVVSTKITVPLISSAVGTSTKLANWRQSPWNNILLNPVSLSVDIYERNTWEPWVNVLQLIADDIIKLKN